MFLEEWNSNHEWRENGMVFGSGEKEWVQNCEGRGGSVLCCAMTRWRRYDFIVRIESLKA